MILVAVCEGVPLIIMLSGALQYQGMADILASFEALQQ